MRWLIAIFAACAFAIVTVFATSMIMAGMLYLCNEPIAANIFAWIGFANALLLFVIAPVPFVTNCVRECEIFGCRCGRVVAFEP